MCVESMPLQYYAAALEWAEGVDRPQESVYVHVQLKWHFFTSVDSLTRQHRVNRLAQGIQLQYAPYFHKGDDFTHRSGVCAN